MAEETKNIDLELDDRDNQEKPQPQPIEQRIPKSPRNYVREENYYSEFEEVDPMADEQMRWNALMQDYQSQRVVEGFLYDVIPNDEKGCVEIRTEIRGFNVLIPDHQYFTDTAFRDDFYTATESEQMRRKLQKGRSALYSRVRFIILGATVTENGDGTREYAVIGSRIKAMEKIRNEWKNGTREHGPLKAGDVVDMSVISVGEWAATVEGFGMECVLRYDQISAFRYVRNVSDELCVGNTVQVLVRDIKFNEDGSYEINISSAALGRSEIERRNAQLKTGASYTATVLTHNITARKYTVIIQSTPARVTVNEDAVLGGVVLQRGDIVSVTVTGAANKNRNINYGTAKYIRSGLFGRTRTS